MVVDLSINPKAADLFLGAGAKEVHGVLHDLEAGKESDMEVRASKAQLVPKPTLFTSRGAIRVDAMRQIKEEDAIDDAVELAKNSDGECKGLYIKLLFTNV